LVRVIRIRKSCLPGISLGFDAAWVGEVDSLLNLGIAVKDTCRKTGALVWISGETDLMRGYFRLDMTRCVRNRRLTDTGLIALGHAVIANVIREILAHKQIIRIPDNLIRGALGVGTRVNDV
jgi:hypothetical protein